ncbi:MarR family transcriptional regulator [Haladaptatus sp. NG-SE-30]
MPIDRDEFEGLSTAALDLKKGTNAHRVVAFLAANDDQAFSRGEIRDGAGIPDGSVGPVLSRLDEDDLVEHRGQYWTLDSDQLAAMDEGGLLEQLREEWEEYL